MALKVNLGILPKTVSHPSCHDYQPGPGRSRPRSVPYRRTQLRHPGCCLCHAALQVLWVTPGFSLLHRLAAIALLVLEDEESAFWCLVAVVETILPAEYYSKTLTASQVSRGWYSTWCPSETVP